MTITLTILITLALVATHVWCYSKGLSDALNMMRKSLNEVERQQKVRDLRP